MEVHQWQVQGREEAVRVGAISGTRLKATPRTPRLCAGVQASRRAGDQRQQMAMVFRRQESSEGFCGLALWCRRLCPERPGEEEYSDIFLQVRYLRRTKPISQGKAGLGQGSDMPRVSVLASG